MFVTFYHPAVSYLSRSIPVEINNRFDLLHRRTMRWIAAITGLFLIFIFPQDTKAFSSVSSFVINMICVCNKTSIFIISLDSRNK